MFALFPFNSVFFSLFNLLFYLYLSWFLTHSLFTLRSRQASSLLHCSIFMVLFHYLPSFLFSHCFYIMLLIVSSIISFVLSLYLCLSLFLLFMRPFLRDPLSLILHIFRATLSLWCVNLRAVVDDTNVTETPARYVSQDPSSLPTITNNSDYPLSPVHR